VRESCRSVTKRAVRRGAGVECSCLARWGRRGREEVNKGELSVCYVIRCSIRGTCDEDETGKRNTPSFKICCSYYPSLVLIQVSALI
jgi:hypothetical protein